MLPSTYGRCEAGVRATKVMKDSDSTAATAPMTASRTTRRQVAAAGQQVDQAEGGQHQPGLDHFGLEGQAHPDAGQHDAPPAAAEDGGHGRVGRQDQQQDHERVGDVAPIQRHGGRAGREHDGRHQAGERAGQATHGPVQHQHGQRALDRLGQHDRPDVEPEEPDRQGLDPQRTRELVHGDGAGRIEGAEEEVVPVDADMLRTAAA